MNNDALNIIVVSIILTVVVFIFIRISLRVKKHGGSMTTTMYASTYEFLGKEHREAAEEIVERKADKKFDQESTGNKTKEV